MTTDKARAEAAEILNWWVDALEDDSTIEVTDDEWELLHDEIAAAIDAAGVPKDFVRTDDGQVRKVLGTLSMTQDGCVIGTEAFVWTMECANPAGFGWRVLNGAENRNAAKKGYSTLDAAKAAKAALDAAGGA